MISAILLGDGLSRKSQWQVQKLRGKPVLLHPIEALQDSAVDQIILAIGKDYHNILNQIKFKPAKMRMVMNRHYDRGLSSYIRAGLSVIPADCEAVIVVRGEYPLIKASLIDRLLEYYYQEKPGILVPTHGGQIGQPVLFSAKYFKLVRRLMGNDLGDSIIKKYGNDVARLEVQNPAIMMGLDKMIEMEDLDTGEIDRAEKEATVKDRSTGKQKMLEQSLKTIEMETRELSGEEKPEKKSEEEKAAPKTGEIDRESVEFAEFEFEKVSSPEKSDEEGPDLSLKMLNDLLSQKGQKQPEQQPAPKPQGHPGQLAPHKQQGLPVQQDRSGQKERPKQGHQVQQGHSRPQAHPGQQRQTGQQDRRRPPEGRPGGQGERRGR